MFTTYIRADKSTTTSKAVANAVQPKLKVGQPNDEYEQEADRVANRVMRMEESQISRQPIEEEEEMLQPQLLVQRQPLEEEEEELQAKPDIQLQSEEDEEKELIQPKLLQKKGCTTCGEQEEPSIQTSPDSHIESCSGQPLSSSTKSFFEPRFGKSFENVKVHTCDSAVQMNRDLNAQAFTYGNNIFFNSGRYNPESLSGKELLAHELTHVVQQKGGTKKIAPTRQSGALQISSTSTGIQRAIQLAAIGAIALRCAIGAVISMLLDAGIQRITSWWTGREHRHDWCSTIMSAITGCFGGIAVGAIMRHMAQTGVRLSAGPILGKILLWLVAQTAVTFPRHAANTLLRLGCISRNQARELAGS